MPVLCFSVSGSVDDSADADVRAVVRVADLDAARRIRCVHDHAVADVESHMACIADEVARLCLRKRPDGDTVASLGHIGSAEGIAEVCIHTHRKAGAVGAVRQARAAVDVRVADELQSVVHNI